MCIDIISYQLAKGITREDLLKAAADIFETWMKNQPGFIKWEINQTNGGLAEWSKAAVLKIVVP